MKSAQWVIVPGHSGGVQHDVPTDNVGADLHAAAIGHYDGLGTHDYLHEGNAHDLLQHDDPLKYAASYEAPSFAHTLLGGDMAVINPPAGLEPRMDVDALPGVHGGMLVDTSGLERLIQLGEVSGTLHEDNPVRSAAAKEAFLREYGYASEPAGYEVHHIIPLSEGGADTPENMVMLSEVDHARVTAVHRQFYQWQ